jgi:hypothetical protein
MKETGRLPRGSRTERNALRPEFIITEMFRPTKYPGVMYSPKAFWRLRKLTFFCHAKPEGVHGGCQILFDIVKCIR